MVRERNSMTVWYEKVVWKNKWELVPGDMIDMKPWREESDTLLPKETCLVISVMMSVDLVRCTVLVLMNDGSGITDFNPGSQMALVLHEGPRSVKT
jgi:hypothetical protein